MEDKLKQSEQARELLAKELVRTKISLEFADNTIKQKEKENAELKAYKDVNEDFKTAWEELRTENAKLKEEVFKWQKAYSRQYQINKNKGYSKKEEQYSQTLQKIKEITEDEIDCKAYETTHDCFNETRCKALNEHIEFLQEILELINESEG